jgi:signal transduction histidine kinase
VDNALNQVGRYLILGTSLSLVLAAIVGAFLARRALTPIDMITDMARGITRTGDLGKRLEITENRSEVGRLAATFNGMLDQIQRLFNTQRQLIADVSHELRTPLTTVQGNVELLQKVADRGAVDSQAAISLDTVREILAEVEGETQRMNTMIQDLLLLAQADSGAVQLQMAPVELDTLLLEVYRQTQRLAVQQKGAGALDVRLGNEDQASVCGDRERLRQLMLNLTDNAIKYTPAGGTIRLGLKNERRWVRISVQDTGIGIRPEHQQLIFNRFYRTDKARSREIGGSGLGLSIVQWIAEAHHGHVVLESQVGHGSTFTVWLPVLDQEAGCGNGPTAASQLSRGSPAGPPPD